MAEAERAELGSGSGEERARPGGRGMGRGLAAILSATPAEEGLREIAVELIAPNPDQPRRDIDGESIISLADSIRERGVLQPLVVRPLGGGRYELIAGERRLRAARMAGLERVPAVVRDTPEGDRLELALIENMAREDLNPIEEARACATLVEDLGLTKEALGKRLGKSRVAVSNLIRLLALPDEALSLIEAGHLSEGHGRALLLCKDQAKRRDLAREAAADRCSVRELEDHARTADDRPAPPRAARNVVIHPDLADAMAAATDTLTAALGLEVTLRPTAAGFRVQFEIEHPREGVELAERILRRAAA